MKFQIAVVNRRIAVAEARDRGNRIGNCTVEKPELTLPGRDHELAGPHYELRESAHGIIQREVPQNRPRSPRSVPGSRYSRKHWSSGLPSREKLSPHGGDHGRSEPRQQRLRGEVGQAASERHVAIGPDEQAVISLTEIVDGLARPEGHLLETIIAIARASKRRSKRRGEVCRPCRGC